ncbi:MAG: hypothetical protein IH855_14075 [Bacteroidetes bacterium]|nr:hypothetical protein [Bacteroidota bacterium]
MSRYFSIVRPFWARYLFPNELEREPEFRKTMESAAAGGMRAAGMFGLGGASLFVLAHLIAGDNFAWWYNGVEPAQPVILWSIVLIAGLGIGLLAAAHFHLRLREGRLFMNLFLLVAALVFIWEDRAAGDIRFTAGWLTLIMFFAVGTVPFQPWQTGVLCVAITALYAFFQASLSDLAGGLSGDDEVGRLIYLSLVTLLCMTMSSAIYVSRYEQYRARRRIEQMQDQLVQKEKLASLGQLAAGLAHEIQNPLNFVNNFAELSQELISELVEDLAASPNRPVGEAMDEMGNALDDLRTNTDKIAKHGRRAEGIVRNMLAHSRKIPGDRRPVDLNELADEYIGLAYNVMRAQHTGFDVHIDREFDAELETILVVPAEIGRVILNLLDNAFDAVRRRKLVEQDGYEPRVRVATKQTPGGATITIADNGVGIPEEHREQIFEPFFTTKPSGEGTGLGLSLAYDIVTAGHGGTLGVDAMDGEWTTFRLALPAIPLDTG